MAQQGQEKKNESNTSGSSSGAGSSSMSGGSEQGKNTSGTGNPSSTSKSEAGSRADTGSAGGWHQSSGSGAGSKMSAIPGGKSQGEEGESEEEGLSGKGATELFRRGKEMATDLAGRAQEYGVDASKEVSAVLKKYPLQSIAVGFGLGIVAGSLISRRS